MRSLTLPDGIPGAVWLAPMAGRHESWTQFLTQARKLRVDRIVCLNPLHEIGDHAPEYLAAIHDGSLPMAWDHLPMRNFGLAAQPDAFVDRVQRTARRLREGETVLLHCAAGIGRTGTFAACLLKALGMSSPEALARVREAGSNPESAAQSGVIERF